jgi:hypothetical protein
MLRDAQVHAVLHYQRQWNNGTGTKVLHACFFLLLLAARPSPICCLSPGFAPVAARKHACPPVLKFAIAYSHLTITLSCLMSARDSTSLGPKTDASTWVQQQQQQQQQQATYIVSWGP